MNGNLRWQKNEGGYYPEWLRETAVALVRPVPDLETVLKNVDEADVKKLAGSTYYQWSEISSDGTVKMGMGAGIALTDKTGLLFYGGGLGWGGLYHDYKNFHGRMVARTVSVGSPEVTAKIVTLENLRDAGLEMFDTQQTGGDARLLDTSTLDEVELRKNLSSTEQIAWAPVENGPLEGTVTTSVVVDREGHVRDVGTIVSTNPAISGTAKAAILRMRFAPYAVNGAPVQVVSRITMPFKTTRPPGMENLGSAHDYFEHGRQAGFLAARSGAPYSLRAECETRIKGELVKGDYVDTWESDTHWRREATIGKSRVIRARNGDKYYLQADGPEAGLLLLVLKVMEPIPAIDTFTESDWKIKRDTAEGTPTIRVLAGYESPDGKLDPEQARGYWFDESGNLLKTYSKGLETRRLRFEDYEGAKVARQVNVVKDGALGLRISVISLSSAETRPTKFFELPGHQWTRAFTDEVR